MVIKTAKYNVYKDGRKLLGLADSIDMPEITARTEDTEVPGGTISVPIPGQFEATEMTIPFQQFFGDIFSMMNTRETVALLFPTNRVVHNPMDPDFISRMNHATRRDFKRQMAIRQKFIDKINENQH